MSAIAGPAGLSPSALLVDMAPLETSPAKCIGLSKLPSIGKGYLRELHTQVKFMVVLAEGTNNSFAATCAWAAFLNSISVLL